MSVPARPAAPAALGPAVLPILCMLAASAVYATLQGIAWRNVGGFEYPLDDVYIHLAVAEQIAAGNYGVNAAEVSSPASSPLYPLLLVPFAGTEAQRWLPLLWNVAGMLASAALFGRILWQAGVAVPLAVGLAVAAPVALNISGLAAVGMEHSLHMAASLAIVSGLLDHLRTGRLPALLWIGIPLAPALRPEGLALALAASAAVALRGRWRAGVALAVLGLLPQVVFALTLRGLGLDAVPSSVLTKLDAGDDGPLADLMRNLSDPAGTVLAGLTAMTALSALVAAARGAREAAWLAAACAAAGAAHLLAGRTGWLFRYEPYALAIVAAGLVVALAALPRRTALPLSVTALALGGLAFLRHAMTALPMIALNPLAIHLQQAQMGRFAHDYLRAPVAVNDLGRVAWTNPSHVLDLWGLASAEARRIRLSDPAPGWAQPLVEAQGVDLAMIYDDWLEDARGPDWVRLGTLQMDYAPPRMERSGIARRPLVLGGREVAFYATRPDAVPRLRAALGPWAESLPPGAVFVPAERSDAGATGGAGR